MDTAIRRGTASDAGELTALAHRAKAYWGYPREWLAVWRDELTLTPEYVTRHFTFVAVDREKIVGSSVLQHEHESWSLEHLWVEPAFQRRGIGRALVRRALEEAARQGASRVEVVADPFAEAFYTRLGARRTAQVPAPMPGSPNRYLPRLEFNVA
jgi:predicted N-acetyltransferase YhbS